MTKEEAPAEKKLETMQRASDMFANNGAEFSPCGKYRYKLWRIWEAEKPLVMCIGLNPSTANGIKDDPTINNLKRMLARLGYGGFYMMNLFAWISSKPADLLTCEDPLGENDSKLQDVAAMCDDVLLCWGTFKQAKERIAQVLPQHPEAKCFGWNKDGTPYHPLSLMYRGETKTAQLYKYAKEEKEI